MEKVRFIIRDFIDVKSSIPDPTQEDFKIIALIDNDPIGYLKCYHEHGKLWAFESFIEEKYRRQGIGTKMYDEAMFLAEREILPHHENPYNSDPDNVSNEAKEFWRKRK